MGSRICPDRCSQSPKGLLGSWDPSNSTVQHSRSRVCKQKKKKNEWLGLAAWAAWLQRDGRGQVVCSQSEHVASAPLRVLDSSSSRHFLCVCVFVPVFYLGCGSYEVVDHGNARFREGDSRSEPLPGREGGADQGTRMGEWDEGKTRDETKRDKTRQDRIKTLAGGGVAIGERCCARQPCFAQCQMLWHAEQRAPNQRSQGRACVWTRSGRGGARCKTGPGIASKQAGK